MTDEITELRQLAELLRARNAIDRSISWLIGRPATPGNIGEWIAKELFDIDLVTSGVQAGSDGVFRSGPLAGKTVNVKRYSEDGALLDIGPHAADYYLVLTGPRPSATKGPRHLAFRLDSIYLFDMARLRESLDERGIKQGIATSVRRAEWERARVYPPHGSAPLELAPEQLEAIRTIALADAPQPEAPA